MMRIENMTKAHVAEVAALEASCFSVPWSAQQLCQSLKISGAHAIALFKGDSVIGYAMQVLVADTSELLRIAVDPIHTRKGYGRALTIQIVDHARTSGCKHIFLEVRSTNSAALALYASLGFEQISLRKGYYNSPADDAVIMRLQLD